MKRIGLVTLSLAACLVLAAVLRVTFAGYLSADEVEHAHETWKLGQGIPLYQSHRQNHMPTLYLLFGGLLGATNFAASSLLIARSICLVAWGVAMALGALALREVLQRPRWLETGLMLLIAGAGVIPLQGYRFRPDPFMAMFVAAAMWAATRLQRGAWRHAFLNGLFTGLAAALSIKMGVVCLLVPLLSLVAAKRERSWRPLAWGPVAFAGFCLGVAPTMAWIWQEGLLAAWVRRTVVRNLDAMNLSWRSAELLLPPTIGLVVVGVAAVLLLRGRSRTPWSGASLALLASAVLTLSIPLMSSSHLLYNLQCFAVPGACLAAMALVRIARRFRRGGVRSLVIAGGLAAVLYEPLHTSLTLETEGLTAKLEDVAFLQQLATGDDECFAFVPMHPIRCRDAAPVYLGWDLHTPLRDDLTPAEREMYRKLWSQTSRKVLARKPRLIVLPKRFWRLLRKGLLNRGVYSDFRRMLDLEYSAEGERSEAEIYVRR